MAFQSVWQEKVFSSSISGDPLQTLAWSGLFAMPFYTLVVPVSAIWHGSWSAAWYRQVNYFVLFTAVCHYFLEVRVRYPVDVDFVCVWSLWTFLGDAGRCCGTVFRL
jgi:hypothetical protein